VRRLLLPGVLALAAVTVGVSTHSASSAPATALPNVSCNRSLLVFLFWPHGHGAIKSVGFSAYKTPHLEVYKYAAGYPNSAFLGFAGANKLTSFAKACRGKAGKVGGAIQHKKTVAKQLVFTCSVPKGALLVTKPAGGGLKLDAGTSSSHVVSALLKPSGSTFSYDTKRCSSGPPPH
jgi:hypothetical protein